MVHWVAPNYHKGCKQLRIADIYDEINGTSKPSDYSGPKVTAAPPSDDLYGYISPDGRYFHCEYGGHSQLASRIVGSLNYIPNPTGYLESEGWAVIHKDPFNTRRYSLGMGVNKKLTNEQVKEACRLGLDVKASNLTNYL